MTGITETLIGLAIALALTVWLSWVYEWMEEVERDRLAENSSDTLKLE